MKCTVKYLSIAFVVYIYLLHSVEKYLYIQLLNFMMNVCFIPFYLSRYL